MAVLGVCPWCFTNVNSVTEVGGMTPVQEELVKGEARWWHQGCVADLTRTAKESEHVGS